ncbi:TITAN-like protein [Lolium perenne]|uniref:TITAN-like protein n=1 Tax=Lolium perenne TaxID=4522 RepID=UPI0021F53F33|nr:TITAN-like protein [Lolium perenne]
MPPKRERNQPAGGGGFEYCELCRRNHDQGRRHRYFPAHRAALANALSGFRSKLSDLRRALLRPSTPPARSRLWCPFCSADLVDLDSHFACSNAIYHLASREHLKGVKDFLRKHGGGMDQVDSFRISEDELAKWEKSCESSSTEAQSLTGSMIGPSLGPFKDIQNETTSKIMDSFAETDIPSYSNTASCVVMPLQSPTNGAYHPTSTACYGPSASGSVAYSAPFGTSGLPGKTWVATHENQGMPSANMFPGADARMKGAQTAFIGNGKNPPASSFVHVQQSHSGGNLNQGLKANVHTGAPPPWLEASENDPTNGSLASHALPSSGKGKSRKLNPKRVGAAWAEKRRAEMEMEKRGEAIPETSDSSWLPNFGGVWQSGSRKESMKDFEKKHKLPEKNNPELSPEIKPYISKRMRAGPNKDGQPDSTVD